MRGLTDSEVAASREKYGDNILKREKQRSFLSCFFGNFKDPVIRILLCALAVNLFFVFRGGDIMETVGIGISVFLATFISTLSERGGEKAFRRLSEECEEAKFRVRRNGQISVIAISDIVVGDIILIGAGEQIPADAEIIFGELTVDQSAMTGENGEVRKCASGNKKRTPDAENAVFRGSVVLSGQGEICVFAVGGASALGQISREVQAETRDSPLKLRLTKLAKQISVLGYAAAFMVALAYLFNTFVIDSAFHSPIIMMKIANTEFLLKKILDAFMLGLTVVVLSVPEGAYNAE